MPIRLDSSPEIEVNRKKIIFHYNCNYIACLNDFHSSGTEIDRLIECVFKERASLHMISSSHALLHFQPFCDATRKAGQLKQNSENKHEPLIHLSENHSKKQSSEANNLESRIQNPESQQVLWLLPLTQHLLPSSDSNHETIQSNLMRTAINN